MSSLQPQNKYRREEAVICGNNVVVAVWMPVRHGDFHFDTLYNVA